MFELLRQTSMTVSKNISERAACQIDVGSIGDGVRELGGTLARALVTASKF